MYSIHTHILVAGWNYTTCILASLCKGIQGCKQFGFFYEGLRLFAERCEREALFDISMHFQSVYTLASNTLYKLWLLFEIQLPLAGKIWLYIQGNTQGST